MLTHPSAQLVALSSDSAHASNIKCMSHLCCGRCVSHILLRQPQPCITYTRAAHLFAKTYGHRCVHCSAGKSRFPGLHVWLADGRRLPVSIPPGCLLCQAGKQMEWLTGGQVKAGMHEVGGGYLVLLHFTSPWRWCTYIYFDYECASQQTADVTVVCCCSCRWW